MSALGYLILVLLGFSILACYFRPPLAFVLMIVLYPLKQIEQTYLPFFVANSALFNVIVAFSVISGALGVLTRRQQSLDGMRNKYSAMLFLLYAFAASGVIWSPSIYAVNHLIAGLPYWALQVLLVPLLFTSMQDFRAAMAPTLVVASIVTVLYLTNPLGVYHGNRYVLQLGGGFDRDFGNPLASAQMGGQMAFIAALIRPRRVSLLWLFVRLGALLLGLLLAVQAGSRGQLVASVFLIVTLFPMASKVKDIKQFFLTAAGFAAVAGVAFMAIKLGLDTDPNAESRWSLTLASEHLETRTGEVMKLLVWFWSEPFHWLFGLGPNAFGSLPDQDGTYVHNVLVEVLCEYGVFGMSLFIALATVTYLHARDLFRRHAEDPAMRSAVAVLVAIGLYSFFLALKQGSFLDVPEPYYFWLLIVKINCGERLAERSYQAQLAEHDAYYAHLHGAALPGYEDVAAAYGSTEPA